MFSSGNLTGEEATSGLTHTFSRFNFLLTEGSTFLLAVWLETTLALAHIVLPQCPAARTFPTSPLTSSGQQGESV